VIGVQLTITFRLTLLRLVIRYTRKFRKKTPFSETARVKWAFVFAVSASHQLFHARSSTEIFEGIDTIFVT
jgi:hypothetical protein